MTSGHEPGERERKGCGASAEGEEKRVSKRRAVRLRAARHLTHHPSGVSPEPTERVRQERGWGSETDVRSVCLFSYVGGG